MASDARAGDGVADTTAGINDPSVTTYSASLFGREQYREWNPDKQRATTATFLAVSLTVILGLVLFGCFIIAVWISTDAAKEIGGLTIPPVATLVGSALGYYFGTHESARR